jgi:hypothetical protein
MNKWFNHLVNKIANHPRLRYQQRIISLQKINKNSSLKYEEPLDSMKAWKDLVLRDKNGKEIGRVMSYGTFCNNDLRLKE